MVRGIIQSSLQLLETARLGEHDVIGTGKTVVVEKIVVPLNLRLFGVFGNNPYDVSCDGRSLEVLINAYPLISLLHVELSQVLKAADGFQGAGVTHMNHADVDPLGGKFRSVGKNRKKVSGKGGDASGGLGADNPVCGNINHTQFYLAGGFTFVQNIVQYRRRRIDAFGDTFFLIF